MNFWDWPCETFFSECTFETAGMACAIFIFIGFGIFVLACMIRTVQELYK